LKRKAGLNRPKSKEIAFQLIKPLRK